MVRGCCSFRNPDGNWRPRTRRRGRRVHRSWPFRSDKTATRNKGRLPRSQCCDREIAGLKRCQVSTPWSTPLASVAAGYLPILLFLIIALGLSTGFVVLPMIVARLTGAHKPDPAKLSEYECGSPAFEDARAEFDVRFYLVAILFIVFDLEAAFLFPWAVSLNFPRLTGWVAMMLFLVELALGLAYAWKKGALEWE